MNLRNLNVLLESAKRQLVEDKTFKAGDKVRFVGDPHDPHNHVRPDWTGVVSGKFPGSPQGKTWHRVTWTTPKGQTFKTQIPAEDLELLR